MHLQLLHLHPAAVVRPEQHRQDQQGRDPLGKDGGVSHPRHAHVKRQHEDEIQHDVQAGRQDQEVEGPLGVPHRPEDAGTDVVEHEAEDAGKVDGQISLRLGEHLRRRLHESEHQGRHGYADAGEQDAQHGGHGQGRMDRIADLVGLLRPVVLGDDHPRAHGQAHEEADEHVDDGIHGAHGAECFLAHVVAHHPGVHRVIELLEQVPQKQGHGEADQEPVHVAPGHVHIPAGEEGFEFNGDGFHWNASEACGFS